MYLTPAAGTGDGNGEKYFENWCSGVYAKYDGQYGSMVFCDGGDKDYWGTELYKYTIDEICRWERASDRATGLNGNTAAGGDPNFDETWGEHKSSDGTLSPGAPHSYDQMGYLSPSMGGGPKGSFLFLTRSVVYQYRAYFHCHAFDLATKTWRRASTTGILQAPDVAMGYAASSPAWALDEATGRFWGMISGNSAIANDFIWWLDFKDGIATAGRQPLTQSYQSPDRYPTTITWNGFFMVAGIRNGAFSLDGRVDADWTTYQPITLTGDPIPPSNGPGLALLNNKLYVRTSEGYRQNLWEISPDWSVKKIAMLGVTVAPKDNPAGMWKRLMAVEGIGLMWVDDISGPVYAYGV